MAKPFTTKIKVRGWGNLSLEEEIEVVVDTGATYTSLPRLLLQQLRVPIRGKKILQLANGQKIEREYGPCELLVLDSWVATIVLFGDENDIPILGTNTMDEASVEVDVINQKLVPVQAIQA